MKKLNKNKSNGFSLMETMLWVGIAATFTSLIGMSSMSFFNRSKVYAAEQEMKTFQMVLFEYYHTYGKYPDSFNVFEELKDKNYISSGKFTDPWKNSYIYNTEANNQQFTLTSLGADCTEGGSGSDSDIVISSENL